jgi:hypothetical protein
LAESKSIHFGYSIYYGKNQYFLTLPNFELELNFGRVQKYSFWVFILLWKKSIFFNSAKFRVGSEILAESKSIDFGYSFYYGKNLNGQGLCRKYSKVFKADEGVPDQPGGSPI